MRPSGRKPDQLRELRFIPDFTKHAEGSVLATFGDTQVLCTASIEDRVPGWMRGQGPWLGYGANTACCRAQRILALVAKRREASRSAAPLRYNGSSAAAAGGYRHGRAG